MKTFLSWNVNGIRAAVKNGLAGFLQTHRPDILGLQEIKITDAAREKAEFDFAGYNEYWNPAARPGYAGTAVFSKIEPLSLVRGIGVKKFDDEGRVQTLEFAGFYFLNIYFPNANHELSRLQFKEDFNETFLNYVKKLERKKPVVVCGDFNVAHSEIDLARPKDNVGNAGFTPEERSWADRFEKHGLVDTFRLINGDKVQYSWWSYRSFARERNIGWRIDYFLVSQSLLGKVKNAFILDDVFGSDHCPVGLKIDL